MQLDGVRHNLGMHATELEAARAYDKFARVSYPTTANDTHSLFGTLFFVKQEHNKKTNFTYPPKQGPLRQVPISPLGHDHSYNQTNVGGPFNDKEGQTANLVHSNDGQNEFAGGNSGNSWSGGIGTTIGDSLHAQFNQTLQPLTGPASSGNGFSDMGDFSKQYNSHLSTEPYQWVHERSQSQDLNWQQSYLQQQQLLHQQLLHDPYMMQAHAAQDSHLTVYIPVPLPISEAVTKYVNDFHRFELQQRQQQQLSQPLHPHSNQMSASTFHPAPIFKEQNQPLSQFSAALPPAAEIQASEPLIDTQVSSLQHSEVTASSSTPAPSVSEA